MAARVQQVFGSIAIARGRGPAAGVEGHIRILEFPSCLDPRGAHSIGSYGTESDLWSRHRAVLKFQGSYRSRPDLAGNHGPGANLPRRHRPVREVRVGIGACEIPAGVASRGNAHDIDIGGTRDLPVFYC